MIPSRQTLDDLGQQVVSFLTEHFLSLPNQPIRPSDLTPQALKALLEEPLPRQAQGVTQALQDFTEKIAARSVRVGHPRFLAWIRPAPLPVPVYAEALAAALNQSVSVWEGAPAATEVELRVLEWLKEMSGFAPQGGGLLTSGGSMANFVCLLAARSAVDPQARLTGLSGQAPFSLYLTRETHYCVMKAAELMGVGRQYVRLIPTDAGLRMQPQALQEALQRDQAAGLRPLAVVATLGTVNSGACDDLLALRQVCQQAGVWLHVDGAYGGLAALVPEKRPLTAGLDQVDSLVFDPHKSLFIPFEAGCALVREPCHLRAAFGLEADYLPNSEPDCSPEYFHFRDFGPQLSRSFRALKIYLTLKTYGVDALSERIAFQYGLAAQLGQRIEADPELELLAPVTLGIVAFRYCGGETDPLRLDAINRWIAVESQRRGEVFLAGTRLHERGALRVCFVSYHTQESDLARILEETRQLGRSYPE